MTRAETLDAAKACVCQNRQEQYGPVENNFAVIADLWTTYVSAKHDIKAYLTADDVAIMLAQMKIARIATGTFKEDSFVDACGYIACAAELAKGE